MITQANESTSIASSAGQTEGLSRSILLMMLLIVINTTALGYKRKLVNNYGFIGRILQDSTVTTLIGVIAGSILSVNGEKSTLTAIGEGYEALFMIILLPAIIFESTINMHKESFFKNIGSILMFAILGTSIALIITASGLFLIARLLELPSFSLWESLAFGSLISATDPVSVLAIFKEMNADKMLYSLIFGESILNDAISITSYNTFVHIATNDSVTNFFSPIGKFCLIFLGSLLLGIVIGIGCALILKKYFAADIGIEGMEGRSVNQGNEISLMIIAPWVSYLIGEAFGMSGIVTLLFCGIAINKYGLPNMSTQAKKLTQNLYHILSSNFENLVFMFLGIGFFSFAHNWEALGWSFFVLSILTITCARFVQVYFVSWILNKFRHNNKISNNFKAVMSLSGFRGAMAFALATSASKVFTANGTGSAILTLTLVYAGLTTFLLGSVLVPLLEYYDVKEKPKGDSQENNDASVDVSSSYLWNRIKNGFGLLDDWLIDSLVKNARKEKMRIMASYNGNDIESPTKDTQASFLSNRSIVVESEMTTIDKSKTPERVA